MRAVIQRVKRAEVQVAHTVTGKIGPGVLILLALAPEDTEKEIHWLASKIMKLRLFDDEQGRMNLNAEQADADFLVVSQFTLYASTRKGNRPSFSRSASPEVAQPLYLHFIQTLQSLAKKDIHTGDFGKHMEISLVNDGPVTIMLDSKLLE